MIFPEPTEPSQSVSQRAYRTRRSRIAESSLRALLGSVGSVANQTAQNCAAKSLQLGAASPQPQHRLAYANNNPQRHLALPSLLHHKVKN